MRDWSRAGYRRAENLVLTSLQLASKIQALFLASLSIGFGIALCRAAKSLYYLVGVVGG